MVRRSRGRRGGVLRTAAPARRRFLPFVIVTVLEAGHRGGARTGPRTSARSVARGCTPFWSAQRSLFCFSVRRAWRSSGDAEDAVVAPIAKAIDVHLAAHRVHDTVARSSWRVSEARRDDASASARTAASASRGPRTLAAAAQLEGMRGRRTPARALARHRRALATARERASVDRRGRAALTGGRLRHATAGRDVPRRAFLRLLIEQDWPGFAAEGEETRCSAIVPSAPTTRTARERELGHRVRGLRPSRSRPTPRHRRARGPRLSSKDRFGRGRQARRYANVALADGGRRIVDEGTFDDPDRTPIRSYRRLESALAALRPIRLGRDPATSTRSGQGVFDDRRLSGASRKTF